MDLAELRKSEHLSATGISDYLECGMLYRFGRVDRLPMEFLSDAMEFGSVIHMVLAEYYQAKMTGDRMNLKDIHESFRQYWQRVAEGREDIQYADGKDFNSYLIEGVDLLTAWYTKLPDDNFKVIGIEESFRFELPNLPVPIIGAIDLVEEDDSGTIIITDFKTSGRAYSIDEVDSNMQMTVYQLAMKANGFGGREILLKLDCLIKTKKPKFEQYYTTRNYVDELRLIRLMQKAWEGIAKGVFLPNPQSFRHRNCPYRQACDKWFLTGGER